MPAVPLHRQHARRGVKRHSAATAKSANQDDLQPDRTHQCGSRYRVATDGRCGQPPAIAHGKCEQRGDDDKLCKEDLAIAGRDESLRRLHLDDSEDDARGNDCRDRIGNQLRKPPERGRGVGPAGGKQERERHQRAGPAGDADSVQEHGRPRQPVRRGVGGVAAGGKRKADAQQRNERKRPARRPSGMLIETIAPSSANNAAVAVDP